MATPEARREIVGRLKLSGYTVRQIGEMVGVSRQTVVNDMKKIRDVWKRDASLSYEPYVQQELAHLREIEQQLSDLIKAGHSEYVRDRIKISESIRKLLGLDSPIKHEISVVSIDALDHEIARLESVLGPVEEIEDEQIYEAEIVDE